MNVREITICHIERNYNSMSQAAKSSILSRCSCLKGRDLLMGRNKWRELIVLELLPLLIWQWCNHFRIRLNESNKTIQFKTDFSNNKGYFGALLFFICARVSKVKMKLSNFPLKSTTLIWDNIIWYTPIKPYGRDHYFAMKFSINKSLMCVPKKLYRNIF